MQVGAVRRFSMSLVIMGLRSMTPLAVCTSCLLYFTTMSDFTLLAQKQKWRIIMSALGFFCFCLSVFALAWRLLSSHRHHHPHPHRMNGGSPSHHPNNRRRNIKSHTHTTQRHAGPPSFLFKGHVSDRGYIHTYIHTYMRSR